MGACGCWSAAIESLRLTGLDPVHGRAVSSSDARYLMAGLAPDCRRACLAGDRGAAPGVWDVASRRLGPRRDRDGVGAAAATRRRPRPDRAIGVFARGRGVGLDQPAGDRVGAPHPARPGCADVLLRCPGPRDGARRRDPATAWQLARRACRPARRPGGFRAGAVDERDGAAAGCVVPAQRVRDHPGRPDAGAVFRER